MYREREVDQDTETKRERQRDKEGRDTQTRASSLPDIETQYELVSSSLSSSPQACAGAQCGLRPSPPANPRAIAIMILAGFGTQREAGNGNHAVPLLQVRCCWWAEDGQSTAYVGRSGAKLSGILRLYHHDHYGVQSMYCTVLVLYCTVLLW